MSADSDSIFGSLTNKQNADLLPQSELFLSLRLVSYSNASFLVFVGAV